MDKSKDHSDSARRVVIMEKVFFFQSATQVARKKTQSIQQKSNL